MTIVFYLQDFNMSGRTRKSMQHDKLNRALGKIKNNLQNGDKPETCFTFELLEEVPQLMGHSTFWAENMNWNMVPRLFK